MDQLYIFSMKKSVAKPKNSGMPTRKILDLKPEALIKQLELGGILSKDEFQFIIESSISVLKFEPNVLKTTSPILVVGDIHGQFFDLLSIFRRHGLPPQTKYVFLGDYVDRGEFSIEVLTLLFWLKLKYPKSIYLLRGNHQCRILTNTHNFKNECKSKYNIKIYELVIILFEVLPICCIVDGKYFCVHAGISPSINTIDQIQKVSRFCEIPEKGILCDLLWSDPTDEDKKEWVFNSMRSCSYFYSREHAQSFMQKNSLEMIIRGHEVQLEGYKYMQFKKVNKKNVLTVFSAPNYCDKYNNLGAVALIENNDISLHTFKFVEHPYVLPNNMNIFEWSIGIISGQAVKILFELMKSRLMIDEGAEEGNIEEIREKLELWNKMEKIKKHLEEKETQQKQLCKSKELVILNEENISFDPKKFLIMILMFLCQKKQDEKDEGMPQLKKTQTIEGSFQQIEQEKEAARHRSQTIKEMEIPGNNQNSENEIVDQEPVGSQKKTDFQPSASQISVQSDMSLGQKAIRAFGPKIVAFTKICPKKK